MSHLKEVQRQSPLATGGITNLLEQSKGFSLKIQGIVAEGSEHGICTVYRCGITSIDDKPITSCPPLCLKLFDDRFQSLAMPEKSDEGYLAENLHHWFLRMALAEVHALTETLAYEKLRLVQGSIVPWFYGIHQFSLPDGTVLYGLLMEYIDGQTLDSDSVRNLSSSRQIKLIQSFRQATRVLDLADITQQDWHRGQALFYTNPITKIDHAVLIDFASTTQTWEIETINHTANYLSALRVLLGCAGDVSLDPKLVWDHFGEPDEWDPMLWASISVGSGINESKIVMPPGMFPYISAT